MAMMESSQYLPDEELTYQNYPEVNAAIEDINDLLNYSLRVSSAIDDYNNGVFDKIDVSIVQLQNYISKCRSILETLGSATNVCYDLIVELRTIQSIMQTLMYMSNRYGSRYVGTPTNNTSNTDRNTI